MKVELVDQIAADKPRSAVTMYMPSALYENCDFAAEVAGNIY